MKYTCPKCKLNYCSLECYQSSSHSFCSESFYKESIYNELNQSVIKDQDKERIQSILHQFEQQQEHSLFELQNESEDDEEIQKRELLSRLGGLDIHTASIEDICSVLTPQEIQDFEKCLESKELEFVTLATPWWEQSISSLDEYGKEEYSQFQIKPISDKIYLNLLEIVYSYAFTWRHTNGDLFEDMDYTCQVILHHSRILSSSDPFGYSNLQELMYQIQSRCFQNKEYGHHIGSIGSIWKDVVKIVSEWNCIIKVLKELKNVFELNQSNRFKISKKLEFYIYLIHDKEGIASRLGILNELEIESDIMLKDYMNLKREPLIQVID